MKSFASRDLLRRASRAGVIALLSLALWTLAGGQHDAAHVTELPPAPTGPLRSIGLLLRQSRTDEARRELTPLLKANPKDAELHYQLARSYLIDFHENRDPAKIRTSLGLAMEALSSTLSRNPDHIPALKAKAVIHARAELLFYDPNLAFQLGARVARLQPSASEYLLNLTEWLSGEVRFSAESEHRVPHDPQLGITRSVQILQTVIDSAMPYSNDEALGFFAMGRALAKGGFYKESLDYLQLALRRPAITAMHGDVLRELAVSYYRLGNYQEAARSFYRCLQLKNNLIDQWLLKTTVDAWKDPGIRVPPEYAFPAAEVKAGSSVIDGFRFDDIAPRLGLDRMDGNGTVAWGDYDGDRRPDVFLAGSGTFLAVYRNEGDKFRDVTDDVGLSHVPSGYSLNLVDYDNDGRLDLYIALNGWNGPMPDRLYRNAGGRFEDVTKATGLGDPGSGFVSVWADFDNDGYLDLAVANGVLKDGSLPQLYRNTGKGSFVNTTKAAGLNEPHTYGAIGVAAGDYDGDGDADLFVNGLINSPNRLYRNDGGFRFTDVTRAAGLHLQPYHNGFVAFFTDADNDGRPDILVTSLAPWDVVVQGLSRLFTLPSAKALHADATRLFRNKGDGTFEDITFQARLGTPMGVMGAGVADLDNDGYVDFYFGTGDPQLSRLEPNRFFANNRDGTFTDLTAHVGFARSGNKGHGVAFIDLDEDGDLELYAQLGGHYPGDHARNALYRNLAGQKNGWLELDLIGVKSNRFAVGAQITVKAGALTVHREVKGSEGFGATSAYRQHFGIGGEQIDSVEILWPSGLRQKLGRMEARRIYAIREGADPALVQKQ